MADFLQTVTNSINCFGPAPSTKWGDHAPYTMTWGTSKWGETTEDLIVVYEKLIDNSQTITGAVLYFESVKLIDNTMTVSGADLYKDAAHLIDLQTMVVTGAQNYFDIGKNWSESQAITGAVNYFSVDKVINETVTPGSTISNDVVLDTIANSISLQMETSSEELFSGDWNYVFPKPTIDAENRLSPTYTSGAAASSSFTSLTGASTIWS